MWVFIFHSAFVTGFDSRFIPNGGIAVDVFMFISGLLMTRNFLVRESREPLSEPTTIVAFLIRRFFRIAPLYYPLLFIGLLFWSNFERMHAEVLTAFPPSWLHLLQNDPSQKAFTFSNALAHISFTFGLFPKYAANNVLPDWSLSLEMQFYLALPFILLAGRKIGIAWVILGLMAVQAVSVRTFGIDLAPGKLGLWPAQSLLLFKINCFTAGLMAAYYLHKPSPAFLMLTLLLVFWEQNRLFSLISLFCFLAMLKRDEAPFQPLIDFSKRLISGRIFQFLGDISYGVYLMHMLAVLSAAHFLVAIDQLRSAQPFIRFALLFAASALFVIPAAYLAHIFIEKPGIKIGRMIATRVLVYADSPFNLPSWVRLRRTLLPKESGHS